MSSIAPKITVLIGVLAICLLPTRSRAQDNQGHHQSGVIGRVMLEQIGSRVFHWHVRVTTETYELVMDLDTDEEGLFAVNLKPGTYVLSAFLAPGGGLSGPSRRVTVEKKEFATIELPLVFGPFSGWVTTPIDDDTWAVPTGALAQGNQGLFLFTALPLAGAAPANTQAHGREGHHQSGITGRVGLGVIIFTPTGEGSRVLPDIVRIYSDTGELVAEVETEVQGNDWWHFQINLKPGSYIVTATVPGSFLNSILFGVVVEKKQFTDVGLTFYTPL